MTIMLLAAGEGQRLRPYTLETPKPAMPILDIPMACFSLHQCLELDPKRLVVNTFHLPDKIKNLYLNQLEKFHKHQNCSKAELYFSDEKPGGELLGGAGGIAFAKEKLIGRGAFMVMNADEVMLPKSEEVFKKMYGYFSAAKPLAMLMTMKHPLVGTQFGGVWVDSKNKVYGFGKQFSQKKLKDFLSLEAPQLLYDPQSSEVHQSKISDPLSKTLNQDSDLDELHGLHFIGPMIVSDRILNYINSKGPSNILYDALTLAISKGETVLSYNIDCEWFETGNPEDYMKTNLELRKILNEGTSPYLKNLVRIWS